MRNDKEQEKEVEIIDTEPSRAVQIREKIQEAKTQALTPRQPYEFQEEIANLIPTAGTLQTTDEQEAILNEPLNELDVEIRPDGLIYLPAHKYQERLHRAFKRRWALIKQGRTHKEGNLILQAYFLVIDGKYVTDAIGEQLYQPDNPTMSYGDAIEGAWSNALMRCCKHLGIGRELWDRDYVRTWKAKHTESYEEYDKRSGKTKTKWRKKGGLTPSEKAQAQAEELAEKLANAKTNKTPEDNSTTPRETPPTTMGDLLITEKQRRYFHGICLERKIPVDVCKRYLQNLHGINSSKEIQEDRYDDIIKWAEQWRDIRDPGAEG